MDERCRGGAAGFTDSLIGLCDAFAFAWEQGELAGFGERQWDWKYWDERLTAAIGGRQRAVECEEE